MSRMGQTQGALPANALGTKGGRTRTRATPTENVLYVFARGKIVILEPESTRIIREITEGLEGSDWADAVVTQDNRLIFANDRPHALVTVIDTASQKVVQRIKVGPNPVHLYNPLHGDEVWTHSDVEAAYYVLDINTLKITAKVASGTHNTGHSKLCYHPKLRQKAYATNTNDAAAFAIDMKQKAITKAISMGEGQPGTHGKAYSSQSGHAYFECTGLGKTAVVDTATDTLIKYLDARGQLFESPDEKLVAVMSKQTDQVHVIDATQESQLIATIPVNGGPDQVAFYQQDGKLFGFTANTLTPDSAVIDFQEMKVIKRIAAGDIARSQGEHSYHRHGDMWGKLFCTPADGDGVVAIIDARSQTLHAAVPVGRATRTAYVGIRR